MPLVRDSFDRANSTTVITPADTGQAWAGTANWGISTNKGYRSANAVEAWISTDPGVVNFTIDVDVTCPAAMGNGSVVFRGVDASNYLIWHYNSSTTVQFFKKVAAAFTSLGGPYTVASYASATVHASIVASGDSLTFYHNGTFQATVSSAIFNTSTLCGFRLNNASDYTFNNFLVCGLSPELGMMS
jgi:hypothetical protein